MIPTGDVNEWFRIDGDNTLRLDYPLNENSLVFDVGAYTGDWARKIYKKYKCRVEMFEPVSAHCKVIEQAGDISLLGKFALNKFGLGGSNGSFTITLANDGSSLYRKDGATEEIQILSISSLLNLTQCPHIDLIKINIEGSEYGLMFDLIDTGKLTMFDHYQIQFHEIDANSGKSREKIRSVLRESGYTLKYDFPWVWESWSKA